MGRRDPPWARAWAAKSEQSARGWELQSEQAGLRLQSGSLLACWFERLWVLLLDCWSEHW